MNHQGDTMVPIWRMTFTVLRVFGPILLLPFAHWAASTPPPC